ncbi:hypothetical protein O181_069413 [Austropuccinia psidii MF-1]|uniref:Uncharacterized protein n=1 Tax=Austropuccinia psidii MF-1 TaxID=1389203 RepID=A0A9Q3EX59_9BASI|nr:hypothetical protein [Austropuccinia psidii MF-1]
MSSQSISRNIEEFNNESINKSTSSLSIKGLEESISKILRQSSVLDFTSHCGQYNILLQSSSRQRQSSHVSHENVTQSPNPFQHYLQCLGNFTSLASASPPNPPRRFACLRARTALQMRLPHFPPISILTTPYAFTPPP